MTEQPNPPRKESDPNQQPSQPNPPVPSGTKGPVISSAFSKSAAQSGSETPNPQPVAAKPAARPADQPAKPAAETPEGTIPRRTFIKWAAVGWAAFAAATGGYLTMVMRYLFPNVLFEPKQSFRAGFPDEYVVGEVSERWKDQHAVWIVRDPEKIYALSTVCTHLGCTPNWLENEQKYKCPCHGSGFYKTGINFEGPAPRPLERFWVYMSDDGEIIVDKTRKFQQEKGEWDDTDSFILV